MKDRIFPTLQQGDGLASEKEFTGINYDKLAKNMKTGFTKEAGKLPDGLEEILNNEIIDDNLRQAKKDEEECEDDECVEEKLEKEECGDGMEKTGRKRKVHFSSAEDISADAIEEAKKTGSEELVNTILAARKQRRIHLAGKIAEAQSQIVSVRTASVNDDIEEKLAKRHEYRQRLAAKIEGSMTRKAASKIKVSKTETFKSVNSLSTSEKKSFAAAAIANGFPQEYVASMLGDNKEVNESETGIKEIMASNISLGSKKTALQGMIKTAKLDGAQKQRLVDYWIKDLGYGDEEWVKNWINKNYD